MIDNKTLIIVILAVVLIAGWWWYDTPRAPGRPRFSWRHGPDLGLLILAVVIVVAVIVILTRL